MPDLRMSEPALTIVAWVVIGCAILVGLLFLVVVAKAIGEWLVPLARDMRRRHQERRAAREVPDDVV